MSETKKNSDEEYDLKKSDHVGQLYPILMDKHGNVIDGFHRLEADPNWRTETRENIDSEEKLLIARAVANWHRRQVSREEKTKWINGLAEIYKNQGLNINVVGAKGGYENQIIGKLVEVTGLHRATISEYLRAEFKREPHSASTEAARIPKVSASHRIETDLGKDYVERHRKEVLEEERPKIEEETAEKLLTDKKFVNRMAKQVLPAHKWVKCDGCDLLTKGEPDEEGKIFCSVCRNKHSEERGFAEKPPTDRSRPPENDVVPIDTQPVESEPSPTYPHLSVENAFRSYAEALKNVPKEKTNKEEQKTVVYATFKNMLDQKLLECPECGENMLKWACGHEF